MPDRLTTLRLLRNSARDLAREVGLMPADAATWRPAEGEWSVHECLFHIRTADEMIFLPRIRKVATEDNPDLPLWDEGQYQKEHWDSAEPFDKILADILEMRAEMCAALAGCPDWSRQGRHETRGPITLEWIADYTIAHTWEHMSQIARVRLNYEVRKP